MTRNDFMNKLKSLLQEVPESEREEALQYYNDYFDDAGIDNEQEVLDSLGSPEQVAASIKADIMGTATGEFTENGYNDGNVSKDAVSVVNLSKEKEQTNNGYSGTYYQENGSPNGQTQNTSQKGTYYDDNSFRKDNTSSNTNDKEKSILAIIILILCSPLIISVVGAVLGCLFGVLGAVIGTVVALMASGVGLIFAAITCVAVGMVVMMEGPMAGVLLIGIGLICLALGLLGIWLTVGGIYLIKKFWPDFVNAVKSFFRWVKGLFKKGGIM